MLCAKDTNTDINERYDHERWYRHAQPSRVLSDPDYEYRRPHLPTLEQLSEAMAYLRPVREFWSPVGGKRLLKLACGDGCIGIGDHYVDKHRSLGRTSSSAEQRIVYRDYLYEHCRQDKVSARLDCRLK